MFCVIENLIIKAMIKHNILELFSLLNYNLNKKSPPPLYKKLLKISVYFFTSIYIKKTPLSWIQRNFSE